MIVGAFNSPYYYLLLLISDSLFPFACQDAFHGEEYDVDDLEKKFRYQLTRTVSFIYQVRNHTYRGKLVQFHQDPVPKN
jgi:hypothetical protein